MRWATCAGWTADGGPQTAAYDAVNRTVAQNSTNYAYNGDGVLVSDGTTTYAQDLAAPLSQVLSDGTDTYVYGQERLRALGGPWYVGDALGSVRQTLDDAGGVLGSVRYDPWGVPTVGTPQPFGFTGELHAAGQVYLRARWYAPGQGRFVSEDPFVGFPEIPYSLHAYQYAYSNPVRWTDPSGEVIPWCPIGYKRITREDGSFGGCEKTGKVPQWVSDISLTLPGPLLVGPAPGVAGQLGGKTLPQLGKAGVDACLKVLGRAGILALAGVQANVDTQTRTNDKDKDDETFVGYHGTTSKHLASILAGINPPTGANYSGFSQLGEGFYTTPELAVAEEFADNAAAVKGGQPVVLKVYARNFNSMIGVSVPKHLWWKQPFPTDLITGYDYLVAPISSYEPAIQYKFNPRAYPYLRVSET